MTAHPRQLWGPLDPIRGCTALNELFLGARRREPPSSTTTTLTHPVAPRRPAPAEHAARRHSPPSRHRPISPYISPISPYISPLPSVSHPAPCTYPAPPTASDNNRFTGGLEPLQDATALRELFVSNNQLSGDLAPIRRCILLQELFLGDNELTGDLEPISACTRMEVLSLDDNKLTGGLEPLQACKGVRTLYLAGPPTPPTVVATNSAPPLTSHLPHLQATSSVEAWSLYGAAPRCRRCTLQARHSCPS